MDRLDRVGLSLGSTWMRSWWLVHEFEGLEFLQRSTSSLFSMAVQGMKCSYRDWHT